MWKTNGEIVGKVLNKTDLPPFTEKLLTIILSYPQLVYKKTLEKPINYIVKKVLHINTPLIIINCIYI